MSKWPVRLPFFHAQCLMTYYLLVCLSLSIFLYELSIIITLKITLKRVNSMMIRYVYCKSVSAIMSLAAHLSSAQLRLSSNVTR